MKSAEHFDDLEELESRLRTMLPEPYQDRYDKVQPVSMGSAGLKYGPEGRVAWDEMWGSFCDLAMAGGPPHKGALLEPGRSVEIETHADRYREVTEEICRGVGMVTGLSARPSRLPGWIRMDCTSAAMAGWLARAIVMENVSARFEGLALGLPAGPAYRLEKEIKNVVTVIAKTSHYWLEHTSFAKQEAIASLLARLDKQSPLLQPMPFDGDIASANYQALLEQVGKLILEGTGLAPSERNYEGWLGIECRDARAAIFIMRTLVVSNVLSRREGTVLFVPVNSSSDPTGETLAQRVLMAYRFAEAKGCFNQQ